MKKKKILNIWIHSFTVEVEREWTEKAAYEYNNLNVLVILILIVFFSSNDNEMKIISKMVVDEKRIQIT